MSDAAIYEAFMEVFSLSYPTRMPAIYPGVDADYRDATIWVEVSMIPFQTRNYGVGDAEVRNGYFRVAVVSRPGRGISDSLAEAAHVQGLFAKGTSLGPAFVIQQPWNETVFEDNERGVNILPVRIPYLSNMEDGPVLFYFSGGDASTEFESELDLGGAEPGG